MSAPWPNNYDADADMLGNVPMPTGLVDAYNAIQRARLTETFPDGDPGEETVKQYTDEGFGRSRWMLWLDEADRLTGGGLKAWEMAQEVPE